MQSLCQGKGQGSHNRRKHFREKIGRAISNLVAVLVSDLWAMAGKNGTVFFQQLAAILNVPFRPNWLLNLSSKGSNIVDFGTILSYARKIRKGLCRLALCQGQRSCRAKNRNIPRKDLYLRFPQITPFQP